MVDLDRASYPTPYEWVSSLDKPVTHHQKHGAMLCYLSESRRTQRDWILIPSSARGPLITLNRREQPPARIRIARLLSHERYGMRYSHFGSRVIG